MRFSFVRSAILATLLTAPLAIAQNVTSSVTGVVTDASGAILPDTAVVLSNPGTGVSYQAKTNSAGSYRFGDVPPGPNYVLTFKHEGFSDYSVKNVYVNVANSRTQDAKLEAGSNVTVEVSAASQGVTINTEDASIGNNFQVQRLNDLPVQDRSSPAVLFTLQPGITQGGATTGARVDQTNTTVDGLDVNDFATGSFTSITGNAPIDSVQEFRGTTAGFTVNSGQGGGGQFNLVTKSGTNQFHGNVNEYHRDNSTTANTWFNDNLATPIRAPKLVRNQFGGNIGGPIKRDKLFFFFNYNASRIAQQAAVLRIVPAPSFAAGNVSYINNGNGCSRTSRQNNQPGCISQLTPAQVKAKDPAGIGESAALLALLKRYPAANDLTAGDGVNTAGYRFNAPAPDNLTGYVGKIDYNLTDKMKFYGRGTVARENKVRTTAQFPGDPAATQFVDRSYAYVAGMDWQIGLNKINRFAYGNNVQDWAFPRPSNALGVNQTTFASGTTTLLADPYASPSNSQSRHTPIQQVTDDFAWQLGRHSITIGGFYKWISASSSSVLDYNTYTLGLGGQVQGFNAAFRPANILPASTTANVTFDSAYAAILGRVGAVTTNFNYDASGKALALATGNNREYRYRQLMGYIGDNWKITPRLTFDFGVNYQYFSVPYEVNGLETVQQMGFDSYLNARLAQSASGNTSPNAVPFFTYLLGGPANNGPAIYNADPKNIAPRVAFAYSPAFDPKTVWSGGASIVYDRTIVNAVQYQQDQYSYLFTQKKAVNYGSSGNPVGSLATDPRYDAIPANPAPATPRPPFTPYVTASGRPTGLATGQFNETIDPNLKTPYNLVVNFGMQHEFPGSLIFKAAYVGRFGRRLLAQADSSQLIDFTDPASGQTLSQAVTAIELQARAGADTANLPAQPFFEHLYGPGLAADPNLDCASYPNATSCMADGTSSLLLKGDFADFVQGFAGDTGYNVGMASQLAENSLYTNKGFSTYHGLLVSLQKNLTHGLLFDVNYTWSHSIDNVSIIANQAALGGYGFVCDALRPRLCRGNSDFDITHIVTGDFTYELPFGRGRRFGSTMPWALNEVLGGWDIAGIPQWQSGQAFSTVSSAFVAGYANNAPGIFNGNRSAIQRNVHKSSGGQLFLFNDPATAAGAFTPPTGFQIGSRGNLRGPQYFNFDAGVAKTFAIWPKENVNFQLRADAFNALNHPNFATPGNNSNYDDISQGSTFGQLTSIVTSNGAGPRVLQLSGRIQF